MSLVRPLLISLIFPAIALASAQPVPPGPDHVVIAVLENRSFSRIIGSPEAPYINGLIAQGTLLTESYGVTHPSPPNYLALFSGSTQGVTTHATPKNVPFT